MAVLRRSPAVAALQLVRLVSPAALPSRCTPIKAGERSRPTQTTRKPSSLQLSFHVHSIATRKPCPAGGQTRDL